jgi:hypothetical protein
MAKSLTIIKETTLGHLTFVGMSLLVSSFPASKASDFGAGIEFHNIIDRR